MLRFGRCGLGVHMEQRVSPGTVQVIAGTGGSICVTTVRASGLVDPVLLLGGGEHCRNANWSSAEKKVVQFNSVLSASDGLETSACNPMPESIVASGANLVADERALFLGGNSERAKQRQSKKVCKSEPTATAYSIECERVSRSEHKKPRRVRKNSEGLQLKCSRYNNNFPGRRMKMAM
jgi:hypothetical protein